MIAEVLTESGYDVCGVARTVAEGIELGERHEPDLAVIDLHLADGEIGTEIGARLRRGGRLGVLYMTGYAGELALTADEGDACLEKPFAPADLVRALQIVERIVGAGAAAPPVTKGFEVLRQPREKPLSESPEMEAANLKIARLLRQQAALARFGGFAFRENDLAKILTEAARACAECLAVPFCKICRYRHEENDLLVEAGVGWHADVVGSIVSPADHSSPQGRAFITGEPVICNDLSRDSAFVLPSLYADHGIVSIVDVIIKGNGKPYGVLEIDSPAPHRYDRHDVDFLTGLANVLAEAVATTKRNKLLRSVVARMEGLVADKDRLLAENHRMLIEKNRLLEEKSFLAEELHHRVRNNLQLELDLDTVTVLGLVVAELISNSCCHAFPAGKGTIRIALHHASSAGEATIVFRDDGMGFAAKSGSSRHGLGLVDRLMEQIRGRAEVRFDHGTAWTLKFPVRRDEGLPAQGSG